MAFCLSQYNFVSSSHMVFDGKKHLIFIIIAIACELNKISESKINLIDEWINELILTIK